MNPFEFVIVIIVLSFIYKLLDVWMRQKAGRRSDDTTSDMLKRLSEVEERVQVLERIVTDERFDLKQQFKDLASK